MRKGLTLLLALVFILGTIMVISCSETTESEPKVVGDPNDPDFQQFMTDVGDGTEFNQMMLEAMFIAMDSVFNNPDNPNPVPGFKGDIESKALGEPDQVTIVYHAASNYWYAEMTGSELEVDELGTDTVHYALADSIQFLHSGDPVQWPDPELLTEVKHGTAMNVWEAIGNDTGVVRQLIDVVGEIVTMGLVTIDGNSSVMLDGSETDGQTTCEYGMDIAIVFNNINADLTVLQTDQGCPSDGSMLNTVHYSLNCTGPDGSLSVNENWSISATYSDGLEHLVVENSTTRWEVDEECGTGPVAVW
jgi:hypothetical protein